MPRQQKPGAWRHVSFRMPQESYDELLLVAAIRGVDLSALLNWIVSEHRQERCKIIAGHQQRQEAK
jgi:hypothetical protein